MLSLKLHTPSGQVPVRALLDTGCELPGVINRRLAVALELPLQASTRRVRTATGETVTGIQQTSVQTHFSADFTRRIDYGVMDIPGFDVILGMGFLHQCAPYQLSCDVEGVCSVLLTSPTSLRTVRLEGERIGALDMSLSPELSCVLDDDTAGQPSIRVQWEVPSG